MFVKPLWWMRTIVSCIIDICGCRLDILGPCERTGKRTTIGGLLVVRILKGWEGNVLCILWRAFWGWVCWEEGDLHSESDGHSLTWFMDLSLLYDSVSNAFWEVHFMSLFRLSKACSNYADLGKILLFLLSFPVMELVHRDIRDLWASD